MIPVTMAASSTPAAPASRAVKPPAAASPPTTADARGLLSDLGEEERLSLVLGWFKESIANEARDARVPAAKIRAAEQTAQRILQPLNLFDTLADAYARAVPAASRAGVADWLATPIGQRFRQAQLGAAKTYTKAYGTPLDLVAALALAGSTAGDDPPKATSPYPNAGGLGLRPPPVRAGAIDAKPSPPKAPVKVDTAKVNRLNALRSLLASWHLAEAYAACRGPLDLTAALAVAQLQLGTLSEATRKDLSRRQELARAGLRLTGQGYFAAAFDELLKGWSVGDLDDVAAFAATPAGEAHVKGLRRAYDATMAAAGKTLLKSIAATP